MSVDLSAIREAGKSVGWIDQRILSIANRVLNKRLEGLRLSSPRIVDLPVVLGTRGVALAVGAHIFFRLSLGGTATVLSWSLAGTVAGLSSARTFTLDVQVGATLATLASVCGANKPALAAQFELTEQPLTGWTTIEIVDPSWIYVTASAVDNSVQVVNLTLKLAVG